MFGLNALSKEGVINILRRLSIGKAKFKELNKVVANTRTLTRRLKEPQRESLFYNSRKSYQNRFLLTLSLKD